MADVKWEYRAVRLVRADDLTELNALGAKGWELVAVTAEPSGDGFVGYAKRERKRR